jgi:phosphoribosylformylglycinamidine synthase
MRVDPYRGAMQAVAEAARNLACVGAEPIAVTDCLNFGNPEKPNVAWQLTEAVQGLSEACRALDVPVVSGNVSLYNETAGRAIPPTPAVGMVGLIEDIETTVPLGFVDGSVIVLLGEPAASLGASEYLHVILGDQEGAFPRLDMQAEKKLHGLLRAAAIERLLRSAQDISDGGLAQALCECAFVNGVGGRIDAADEVELFSEDQGRALVTCWPEHLAPLLKLAQEHRVPAQAIGRTGGDRLRIGSTINASLADLRAAWEGGAQ